MAALFDRSVSARGVLSAGPAHASHATVRFLAGLVAAGLLWWPLPGSAQGVGPTPQTEGTPAQPEAISTETYGFPLQSTGTQQFQPAFPSKFQGPQSLSSAANGRETVDVTAYLGVRPWEGAEIWFDPEVDQ